MARWFVAGALCVATVAWPCAALRPGRVELSWLEADADGSAGAVLVAELQRTGVVQVGAVEGLGALRREVLGAAVECAAASSGAQASAFADGTSRLSLAARWSAELGREEPAAHGAGAARCARFDAVSARFRDVVQRATEAFAARVQAELPLGAGRAFAGAGGFAELSRGATHLEHFHSYSAAVAGAVTGGGAQPERGPRLTVEMHVDQGLFIAFVPALMVARTSGVAMPGRNAGSFLVELRDGRVEEVEFDDDGDVVCFLLGDGVEASVNAALPRTAALRAAPHAFAMPVQSGGGEELVRAWYGRMIVLGPLATAQARSPHAVGCSGGRQARELAPEACAANQLFCWHRCMNFTATVSPGYCRDVLNLGVQCGSQYGQISDGDQHGDYEPMCTNATEFVTPHPTIPPAADRDSCARELAPLEARDRAEYASFRKLSATTYLAWSVTSDGWLRGKMLHNGTTGYLAFGLSGPPGMPKNGMHGAEIVMGIAREGGGAGSVNEYRIHSSQTPFRFWNTTLKSQSLRNATMQVSDCYAAITFETKHFGSRAVELGGTNKVTWAVHESTWRVQYHGFGDRGTFNNFDFRLRDGLAASQSTSVPSSMPTTPPTPQGQGLSPGAIAGIVLAAFVAIAAGAFVLVKTSKREVRNVSELKTSASAQAEAGASGFKTQAFATATGEGATLTKV
jgi:hypothetical protein